MRISDWSSDVCGGAHSDPVGRMQRGRKFYAFSASTPGNGLPSIHSRKAPPAVETKVKSLPTPAWLSAATVSPPPATEISEPSRSEEHTSELQSLMRNSYAVFCLHKKKT